MNIDRSLKLSLETFNASNLDMEDFETLMRGLDENFEASQSNVQFQKIWAATVAGILVFFEKRKMLNTELTALRQLFHALSNSAAGGRETRLNYPWSGSRGDKSYSILDEDKRARAIVTSKTPTLRRGKLYFHRWLNISGKLKTKQKFCARILETISSHLQHSST